MSFRLRYSVDLSSGMGSCLRFGFETKRLIVLTLDHVSFLGIWLNFHLLFGRKFLSEIHVSGFFLVASGSKTGLGELLVRHFSFGLVRNNCVFLSLGDLVGGLVFCFSTLSSEC